MKRKQKHGKSIMQKADRWDRCYLCMSCDGDYRPKAYLETHHVLFGAGRRKKAEEDGLTVRLCKEHHDQVHKDDQIRQRLCSVAQAAWERKHIVEYGETVRAKWLERYIKDYRRLVDGTDNWDY